LGWPVLGQACSVVPELVHTSSRGWQQTLQAPSDLSHTSPLLRRRRGGATAAAAGPAQAGAAGGQDCVLRKRRVHGCAAGSSAAGLNGRQGPATCDLLSNPAAPSSSALLPCLLAFSALPPSPPYTSSLLFLFRPGCSGRRRAALHERPRQPALHGGHHARPAAAGAGPGRPQRAGVGRGSRSRRGWEERTCGFWCPCATAQLGIGTPYNNACLLHRLAPLPTCFTHTLLCLPPSTPPFPHQVNVNLLRSEEEYTPPAQPKVGLLEQLVEQRFKSWHVVLRMALHAQLRHASLVGCC